MRGGGESPSDRFRLDLVDDMSGRSDMTTVGVVGLGVVGGTVEAAFRAAGIATRGYDRYRGIGTAADLGGCSVVFLCVPTPSGPDGGHDLTEIAYAVREIEAHVEPRTVIAIKSTIPPGTCDELAAQHPRLEFASVPEFLVASRAVESFVRPDRIVIGARSPDATAILEGLMKTIAPEAPVVFLAPAEAELVKLCSNAMLAAKVSMANELSDVCARFGVEWSNVQAVVGLDRRIGPEHLTVTAERGFGGECLPKDLDGLIAASRGSGYDPALLSEIGAFNQRIRPDAVNRQIGEPVFEA
jgi:UDPglucose 6-dehydrogenase